jgi:hypothetical protein
MLSFLLLQKGTMWLGLGTPIDKTIAVLGRIKSIPFEKYLPNYYAMCGIICNFVKLKFVFSF